MNKALALLCLTSSLLVGCKTTTISSLPTNEDIMVSQIKETKSKRKYIEVDGNPFNFNGAQIRIDWLLDVQKESINDLEYYFQESQKLGIKMVELPIQWKDIEPREGAYDFRNLSKILSLAKKYNLKVEILLFTINIGGMSGTIPDYIKNDTDKYPQYKNTLNHPDALFFVQTNENLLKREALMVEALMNAIYDWSKQNNSNTVISIQVRNEPDLYAEKRITEHELRKENGELLTYEEAWEETLYATEYIGKVVKASKYKVITRVNLCCFNEDISYTNWQNVCSLSSIDLVGEDTYNSSISFNKNIIIQMKERLNSYPQIAENTGHFINTASLYLMTNMLGGGYSIYDLITPSVITNSWGYYDWGILDNITKQEKPAFALAKKMLDGINKAGPYFAITDSEDIAIFNVDEDLHNQNKIQSIRTSKTQFDFKTEDGSLAYAINNGDYIYLLSTEEANFKIQNSTIENNYEIGYVKENGEFISEDKGVYNQELKAIPGLLYRFKVIENEKLNSNTIQSII